MPYVTRPGQPTLYYELDDYTDPWRQAPFIFLHHGFSRHSLFWHSWIPYLSRHYRVLRADMRGFGQSTEGFDAAQGFAFADLAEDVAAVIRHAGADSTHFCGEHFGGTLGMQFAADYPQLVRTLNLIAAPVELQKNTKGDFAMGESSWGNALRKYGVRKWAEETNGKSRFPPSMSAEFLNWYSDEVGKADVETVIAFSELCSEYNQIQYLPRITAPVLGMYARTRGAQMALLREHVKRVSVVEIPTDYFMFYQLYPRLCAETVLHFCAAHDGIPCTE